MNAPSLSRYFNSFTVEQEVRYTEETSHILHASDLYTACMREIYLLWESGEKKTQSFPFDLWLKFETGKFIEKQVKAKFDEKGILESAEVHLFNEEYGISFHPDARLKNNQLVEIKSKSAEMFRLTKNFPLRKDQYQLELYLWADAAQTGILFVFTWDGKTKISSRDHIIHYNMRSAEITKRTVATLREAEKGGKIPLRICQSKDEKRAIFCPMRERCFQLESHGLTKTIEEQLKGTHAD
jgi:hypothetical protein